MLAAYKANTLLAILSLWPCPCDFLIHELAVLSAIVAVVLSTLVFVLNTLSP